MLFGVIVFPLFLNKSKSYFNQEVIEFDESLSMMELISELEADYLQKKINQKDFESTSLELKRKYLVLTNKKS